MTGFGLPEIPLKTNMALALKGKDGVNSSDWLFVYPIASRGGFDRICWYGPLEMNGESKGARPILI